MEKHKFKMAREFARKNPQMLEEAYAQVMALAKSARECYEDDKEGTVAKFNEEEFTKMMFLDGCFVVQFIYCFKDNPDTSLGMKRNDAAWVKRDLFLLENQLPFKVLEELMKLKLRFKNNKEPWGTKLGCFIENILGGPQQNNSKEPQSQGQVTVNAHLLAYTRTKLIGHKNQRERCHLLKKIRNRLIEKFGKQENQPESGRGAGGAYRSSYRSAMELKMVGITFKPSESHQLISVKFNASIFRNELCLPSMTIDDSTESLLLNMAAYEACADCPGDVFVTSYICFLDSLIDHAADVKLLRSEGILHNFLGSDEQIAILFNEIADNLVPNQAIHAGIRQQIEKHYNSKIRNWLAEFWHTHFTSPWTILAFLGAILALVLTVIQTYVTMFPPGDTTTNK
ncbi:hypothetical protein OWV82_019945 [Melia azedarach]|uniref:Uncharacterized protein n=1 Tax=Melia azedarach TaxID=155640 RepID=A0ACC1X5P6_MELAZ|nr:hypothetical protein OWV82_019945 [Melia azedarach]